MITLEYAYFVHYIMLCFSLQSSQLLAGIHYGNYTNKLQVMKGFFLHDKHDKVWWMTTLFLEKKNCSVSYKNTREGTLRITTYMDR